jgi:hypothetical protein
MMATKIQLTIGEKIDRAKDGRTQKSIVNKMTDAGCKITEVQFSRKKAGDDNFTDEELNVLSEILNTKF